MKMFSILLADSNNKDADFIQGMMSFDKTLVSLKRVKTLEELTGILSTNVYDIIYVSLNLSDATPETVVKAMIDLRREEAWVILADEFDESLVNTALKNGAQDYMIKTRLNRENFMRITEYSMTRHRLINKLESKIEELEQANARIMEQTYQMMRIGEVLHRPAKTAVQEGSELFNSNNLAPEQRIILNKLLSTLGLMMDTGNRLVQNQGKMDDFVRNRHQHRPKTPEEAIKSSGVTGKKVIDIIGAYA